MNSGLVLDRCSLGTIYVVIVYDLAPSRGPVCPPGHICIYILARHGSQSGGRAANGTRYYRFGNLIESGSHDCVWRGGPGSTLASGWFGVWMSSVPDQEYILLFWPGGGGPIMGDIPPGEMSRNINAPLSYQ